MSGWLNSQAGGWMMNELFDGLMSGWINELSVGDDGWKSGWMDEWMDEQIDWWKMDQVVSGSVDR